MSRRRRWAQRLLLGLNIVLVVCVVALGGAYVYVRLRVSEIKAVACRSCTATAGPVSDGLTAMNILLIGSNTRTGLDPKEAAKFGSAIQVAGARSDVTMVLHLDPAKGTASLLSIPRDLFVDLPPKSMAGKFGKIDAALNDGPDNLIAAVQDSLGIPINHYLEVNFDGFQRTVDAIGGISLNFPTGLRDSYSGLKILTTGCQHLDGATALAVVRARHLQYQSGSRWADDPQSDLARIRRNHMFLRVFAAAARSQATNPLRLNALTGALLAQVTVDTGLSTPVLLALYRRFGHLDPNTVPQTTLPITVVPSYDFADGSYGDVDFPVEPLDHQVIDTWNPPSSPATIPIGTPIALSYTGTARQVPPLTARLNSLGLPVSKATPMPSPADNFETKISYHPGEVSLAKGLLDKLSGAVMMHVDPAVPAGTLGLAVGTGLVIGPAPSPPATPALAEPAASGGKATTTTAAKTATGLDGPSSALDQAQPFDPTPCP